LNPGTVEEGGQVDRSEGTFSDFVADVEPALLGTAFLLTGRRREAQDAVVAALASVHRHWRRSDPATAAAEARRLLVADVLRRHRSAPQTVGDLPAIDDLPAADAAWLQALAGLPVHTRAALVLRLYDGLDDDGTAELLGQDRTVVAGQVEAALDELAPLLQDDVLEESAPPPLTEEEFDGDDPDAPFRRPEAPDPTADPYAAFRRPDTPPAPRLPVRPTARPLPAPTPDDDALYRRPGSAEPARAVLPPSTAPDDDPDALYRRPR
jgi:DNA-directed RNA polymerase specialized sigma24 family protein